MVRLLAGLFCMVALLGTVAAQDKKDTKEKYVSWERDANGLDLKLDVGKETLKISASSGDNGVIATCKMIVDKSGKVMAKITKVEEKGNFPAKPKVGLEFSFKWKVNGDTATLSDLEGDEVQEAKAVLEGDYKKKK
jgi:hypothetical protein